MSEVLKWRDKDGDVWRRHDDKDYLLDTEEATFRRDTVEKQWGPLVPIEWEKPPTLWQRGTATWQRRLTIAATALILIASLVSGFLAVSRGDDPTWFFLGPTLVIAIFIALVTAFIRVLLWIWPDL